MLSNIRYLFFVWTLGAPMLFSPSVVLSQEVASLETEVREIVEEALDELRSTDIKLPDQEIVLTFYGGTPTPMAYAGNAINIPPKFLVTAYHRAHFQALTAIGYEHAVEYAVNDPRLSFSVVGEAMKMTTEEKKEVLNNCNKGIWGSGIPAEQDKLLRCMMDRIFGKAINDSILSCRNRAHSISFAEYSQKWDSICDHDQFGYLVKFAALETMRDRLHLALKFVVLHEFGHIVLMHESSTSENEFSADLFAYEAMRLTGYGLLETVQASYSALDTYQDVWDHALATLNGVYDENENVEDVQLDPSINITDLARSLDPVYGISSCRLLRLFLGVGIVSEEGRKSPGKIINPSLLDEAALSGRFLWEKWFVDETVIRVMSVGQMVFQDRDKVCAV